MPLLVEYACGCIGLPPHEELAVPTPSLLNERMAMAFIVKPCDGDSELQCTLRQVALDQRLSKTETRTSRYLTLEECGNVFQSVNFLLGDGYRYRELRSILGLRAEYDREEKE
jgi:hypothetical protein